MKQSGAPAGLAGAALRGLLTIVPATFLLIGGPETGRSAGSAAFHQIAGQLLATH